MEVDLVACAGTASEVVEAHAWASYECRRSASTGGTCKKRTRLSILLGHISNRMRKQFTKILRTALKKTIFNNPFLQKQDIGLRIITTH